MFHIIFIIYSVLLIVNTCIAPSNVSEFVWNPVKVNPRGYFLPMSLQTQNNSVEELFPGIYPNANCFGRFWGSSVTTETRYEYDGGPECTDYWFKFQCFHVGTRLWTLDCKYDDRSVPISAPPPSSIPTPMINETLTPATVIPPINGAVRANTFASGGIAQSAIYLSHTVIISLTDHKTYAFMNRCFYKTPQTKFDWIVLSTMEEKELSPTTRAAILAHASILGYKI